VKIRSTTNFPLVQPILSVQGRPAAMASARARVFTGPVVTTIQPIQTVRGRPTASASTKSSTTPYWTVGPSASALLPVPRLIAVWAVLWVINTLHDPHRAPTACQHPVPCSSAQVQCQHPYGDRGALRTCCR